jgi:IS30 family transposase
MVQTAANIGVNKSTISRELKRNRSKRGYRPQFADRKACHRRREKVKSRITERTWMEVEAGIREQWSPEQISGRRSIEGKQTVSHEWIYHHIYLDKATGGGLYMHLRCRRKRRKRYGSYSKRGRLTGQISIEQRPTVVAQKSRIGDWELDTVIGQGHHQALVSMVDRKSKLLRMEKVEQKTGKLVRQAICHKLNGLTVHTMTSDNGREFSQHQQIAEKLNAGFYFCHPYSSWERGLNENTNGLIRQYFPKQMKFAIITDELINQVEDKLNNRPRKTLGYQTPNEVYFKEQEQPKVALTT